MLVHHSRKTKCNNHQQRTHNRQRCHFHIGVHSLSSITLLLVSQQIFPQLPVKISFSVRSLVRILHPVAQQRRKRFEVITACHSTDDFTPSRHFETAPKIILFGQEWLHPGKRLTN